MAPRRPSASAGRPEGSHTLERRLPRRSQRDPPRALAPVCESEGGKIDAELGETMVCTLDSLADLIRLEVERMHGADGKEDAREQPRNAS